MKGILKHSLFINTRRTRQRPVAPTAGRVIFILLTQIGQLHFNRKAGKKINCTCLSTIVLQNNLSEKTEALRGSTS